MSLSRSIKRIVLWVVQYLPSPLIQMAYKLPFVARLGSKLLKHATASGQSSVVTIRQGPLAGKKLQVNAQTPHYYWIKGHDEPAVVAAMQNIIKPGHTVIDVGAHIGIETMMLCQWVGDQGKVFSIEPDPSNFQSLSTNVELNDIRNVKLMQVAVANTAGKLQFICGVGVLSRLVDDPDDPNLKPESLINVQVHTLDELFLNQSPSVDFLKIDVEDFEVTVLQGAKALLRQHQPAVILELHSSFSAKGCAAMLLEAGYQLKLVDTREKDLDAYLASQPKADFNHGFERFHILATPQTS